WTDVDVIITMPNVMAKAGRRGKTLGPRGLMTNPQSRTVPTEVGKAVQEVKAGKNDLKDDTTDSIHASIGQVSSQHEKPAKNVQEVINTLVRLKPAAAKGTYLGSIHLSSTMSPSVSIDKTTIPGI